MCSLLLASCAGGNSNVPSEPITSSPEQSEVTSESTSEQTSTPEIKYVSKKYSNPVFDKFSAADPSVYKDDDGTLYIYSTGGAILKTKDCVNYEHIGSVKRTINWGPSNNAIWAPDIIKVGDTYNYYYANSNWGTQETCGIGVMTSTTPYGPFVDHGKLFTSDEIGVNNSIDPVVFYGDNNDLYMIWGSFRGNYAVRLTDDGLALYDGEKAKDTKTLVAGYPGPFDLTQYEGAYILKKDGWYYLFLSSGSCCEGANSSYHLRVARSKKPLGPYVDAQGGSMLKGSGGEVLLKGNQNGIIGPGHNSVFKDDAGDYWLLAHGYDHAHVEKARLLVMQKLKWRQNGFPYVTAEGDVKGNTISYGSLLDGPRFIERNK